MRKQTARMKSGFPQMSLEMQEMLLQMRDSILAFPWAARVVLYGSYAKGCQHSESDVDLAVFVQQGYPCHLEEYRQLARICRTAKADIQVQAFSESELADPCGIVEEIAAYGIDITRLVCADSEELSRKP